MRFYTSKGKNKEMVAFSDREWSIADKNHFWKSGRWIEDVHYIRAVDDNVILGILHYCIKAGVMEIVSIVVSHSMHRQGIGRALIEKAEKIAKQKGVHKIFLTTGVGWDAINFYEKLGYQNTGELKKHYLMQDLLIFSKELK